MFTRAPRAAEEAVRQAWAGNLALARAGVAVEQARARLGEVRAAYQPRVDVVARYSRADGGRVIDLPLGDLLNGAYATLNDYLIGTGRPGAFSGVANQAVPLLREREQETKLRLVQPLYRPDIGRGVAAGAAELRGREAEWAAYRRELRELVLWAHYRVQEAESALAIWRETARVTAEAERVNRVLFANGRATEDQVLRAEAEALAVVGRLAGAERDRGEARHAFNFLLNRPLGAEVAAADDLELEALAEELRTAELPEALDFGGREELAALAEGVKAAAALEELARVGGRPTLALAVEGGIQGESYRTGAGSDFVQASLVAEWNLWDGAERRQRVERARWAQRERALQRDEVQVRLDWMLRRARADFEAARRGFEAADRRATAAARALNLVQSREREGLVNQLDFFDARREATAAALERATARQRLLGSAATLDRAATLSPIFLP